MRLPAVAFGNNKHVGALIAEMLARLPSQGAEGENEYAALWVNKVNLIGNKLILSNTHISCNLWIYTMRPAHQGLRSPEVLHGTTYSSQTAFAQVTVCQ